MSVLLQIVAEGDFAVALEQRRRLAIETQNFADEAVKRRLEQVAPLREQRVKGGAVVFET